MKEVTHIRQGKNITIIASNETSQFSSINAAKRASREMQSTGAVVRVKAHKVQPLNYKLAALKSTKVAEAKNPRPTAVEQGKSAVNNMKAPKPTVIKKKVKGS